MSITERGETVRSKAEKVVADYLYQNQIEYVYEQTIELGRKKEKIKYDFYLTEQDVYIEYWGLGNVNGEVGEQYEERKAEKIELYDRFDLKLLVIKKPIND